MAGKKIVWDADSARKYETGLDHGIVYIKENSVYGNADGKQDAFNGLTSLNESPEGADITTLWADNIKYLQLQGSEEWKGSIEAYTYPDIFMACDGSKAAVKGMNLNLQDRATFGLYFRTKAGDAAGNTWYKHHLLYGLKCTPSSKGYETVNDNPSAITFSWDLSSTPETVGTIGGVEYKPVSVITIDERDFCYVDGVIDQTKKAKLDALLTIIEGVDGSAYAKLPMPSEVYSTLTST